VAGRPDIALVSLGTTIGLRRADAALAEQIEAAGAACEVVPVALGAVGWLRRAMAVTDLVEAFAARRAMSAAARPRAFVVSTVTAALLVPAVPEPVAVRFDGIAALNRPGAGGAWQRRRERSVLGRAALLLPWSEAAADVAAEVVGPRGPPAVVLPPPVAGVGESAPCGRARDGAPHAVSYAANPDKRGLELLCEAWSAAALEGGRLTIGGLDRAAGLRWLERRGVAEPAGVEWAGTLAPADWSAIVAGADVFVSAARYEDFGIAQLEALAAGTPLVTVPTPGANAALPLARELAPQLVASARAVEPLARALRAGVAMAQGERQGYAAAARRLLEPYREEELRRRVADEVLPRLLASSSS
jgi:glycosyltransferase involved in cell wall biosynthesis